MVPLVEDDTLHAEYYRWGYPPPVLVHVRSNHEEGVTTLELCRPGKIPEYTVTPPATETKNDHEV